MDEVMIVVESGFAALPADKQYERDQNEDAAASSVVAPGTRATRRTDGAEPVPTGIGMAAPDQTLRLSCGGPEVTKLTLQLDPDGDGRTQLVAAVSPFALRAEDVGAALAETARWTTFGLAQQAKLEHGIDLRVA